MSAPSPYPAFVERLTKRFHNETLDLLHAAVGMAGEAGETLDLVKKVWVYGKPLDPQKLLNELGDIRFYYQMMLNALEVTDDEIVICNMTKLLSRYPQGYTDQAAIERKDTACP